jgi:hypothetical protein
MINIDRNGLIYLFLVVACVFPMAACTAPNDPLKSPKAEIPVQAAKFEVAPLKVTPKWLFVGDNATVNTSVANTGEFDGVYKAVFSVDGQKSSEQEITVPKGQAKEISFPLTSTSPGIKSVAVGNIKSEVNFFTGQQPYTIQYDNYEMQMSMPTSTWYAPEPYGQIVRFTSAAKPFRINKIQVAAITSFKSEADKNKMFTINIWDLNRKKLWTKDFPWRIFSGGLGTTWQDLEVPNIRVEDEFFVELVSHTPADQGDSLNQGQASWLGLGYNKSDSPSRSNYSNQGQPLKANTAVANLVNYCIRVLGDGSPLRVIYYDDAAADMYKASSDFSHVVSFAAPSYPFDLRLIQLYAYRDIKEIGDQLFTVKVIDKTAGTVIWQKNIPLSEIAYSGVKLGSWTDIDTGGVTCNHDFFIELTTNNGPDGPVWLGCDTTAKNRYSDMAAGGNIITWREWKDTTGTDIKTYSRDNTKWMIRAAGIAK